MVAGASGATPSGLAIAFELTAFGLEVRLERHRREHPGATEADLAEVERQFYRHRPGAEHGDVSGQTKIRSSTSP